MMESESWGRRREKGGVLSQQSRAQKGLGDWSGCLAQGGCRKAGEIGREADDAFVYSRVLLLYVDHAAYW